MKNLKAAIQNACQWAPEAAMYVAAGDPFPVEAAVQLAVLVTVNSVQVDLFWHVWEEAL